MNALLRLVTLLLVMANSCLAINKTQAWKIYMDVTGADIKGFFQKGALDKMLNKNQLLKRCLVNDGKLLPSQEVSDLITRIMIERVGTKINLLDKAARQTAWLNLNLVIASMCRSDPESLGRLIRELGEEGTGDFLEKVVKVAGGSGEGAGAMDAIYLGDILAFGMERRLFSSFGGNSGNYTADVLLDRLIAVNEISPLLIRSSNRVLRTGQRGVFVGLIGLISNKNGPSAVGFLRELDAAHTLKGLDQCELIRMGHLARGIDGRTDMDVLIKLQNDFFAVQVRVSADLGLNRDLGRWVAISSENLGVPASALPQDMLAKVKFMHPPGSDSTEEVAEKVADALMLHPRFEKMNRNNLITILTQNDCIIPIQLPSL